MLNRVKEFLLKFGARYEGFIWFTLVGLAILPLIITLNDLLTQLALGSGINQILEKYTVPVMVRLAGTVLEEIFKIETVISGSSIYMMTGGLPYKVDIVCYCVGWQSFVLLAFTFLTGLKGPYTWRNKLMSVLIGLEGTFLINVIRILIPPLLAHNSGYLQAIIFHDYLGTLFTLLWMGVFWNYAFGNILLRKPMEKDEEDKAPSVGKKGILDDIISGELGREK